jgi:hypothetical protein
MIISTSKAQNRWKDPGTILSKLHRSRRDVYGMSEERIERTSG